MLTALGSLESLAPTVSIETELAMEQLKERYEQEIQDLKIQLETKVKIYKNPCIKISCFIKLMNTCLRMK